MPKEEKEETQKIIDNINKILQENDLKITIEHIVKIVKK